LSYSGITIVQNVRVLRVGPTILIKGRQQRNGGERSRMRESLGLADWLAITVIVTVNAVTAASGDAAYRRVHRQTCRSPTKTGV
jgi:hypothetical protein